MTPPQDQTTARLIPLLVVGIMLNTLGIVLTGLGNLRFVLMGAGVLMMLAFIVKALAARKPRDS